MEAGKMAAVRELRSFSNWTLAVRNRCHLPLGLGVVSDQLRTFSMSGTLNQAEKEQELQKNPFYSKYQTKIQELRRAKPDEYEARMAKKEDVKRHPLGHSKQGEFIRLMEQKSKELGERATEKTIGFNKSKTLHSILNMDMVKEKTPEEIGQIWNQYFALKNTISAVIPGATFDLMHSRSQKCPTSLGMNSPSQLIIYHYPDLQKEKGIVLLTAEIDTTFLNVQEAQCLANEAQLFYATDCQKIYNLVETFNHKSSDFKHTSVIAEIEQCGIGGSLMGNKSAKT
ncbi:ATP synthase mitochondrial F1 complex assembly factor 1 isoform X2 [Carcharodon carcharias]|uniref:ATP synthase mitochondrial F1 complex assembly factor 1 isoform X2 n=1 Tax=Carcharodon carcharias TaxID=13397 RepID=UPI001B7DEEA5|nr:ATP synthase mitochondrial F1 complex assembly factor 1 isoform X2 [Carcharodon carcharias]